MIKGRTLHSRHVCVRGMPWMVRADIKIMLQLHRPSSCHHRDP